MYMYQVYFTSRLHLGLVPVAAMNNVENIQLVTIWGPAFFSSLKSQFEGLKGFLLSTFRGADTIPPPPKAKTKTHI